MGLDSVEILMKVENTFAIRIPDEEAERIITVSDFHNAVWKYVKQNETSKCKSQLLFYKLRSECANYFQIPKSKFLLKSSLNEIIPWQDRRAAYFDFAGRNNLVFPDLVLTPPWKKFMIIFGGFTIFGSLLLSIILTNFSDYSNWLFLTVLAAILLTMFMSELLNPFRIVIEPSSIRDFISKLLALNYAALSKDSGVNRREVESVINYIISDLSGLEIEEVTSKKKIHDDLGID